MADEDHIDTDTANETGHGLTVGDPVPISALNGPAETSATDQNEDFRHAPDNPAPEDGVLVSGMRPATAAERLFHFEETHFGPECVRIDGQVERGSGSPFSQMSDEDKAAYAALERLVAAEAELNSARAALAVAEAKYAEAEQDAG